MIDRKMGKKSLHRTKKKHNLKMKNNDNDRKKVENMEKRTRIYLFEDTFLSEKLRSRYFDRKRIQF